MKDEQVNDFWELHNFWEKNPDALGVISIKKRGRVDSFGWDCYLMYKALLQGKTVGIMSMTEDLKYLDRVENYLLAAFGIEVTTKRLTRIDPPNNFIYIYNRYDEVIGVYPVEQKELFVGWELKIKEGK